MASAVCALDVGVHVCVYVCDQIDIYIYTPIYTYTYSRHFFICITSACEVSKTHHVGDEGTCDVD